MSGPRETGATLDAAADDDVVFLKLFMVMLRSACVRRR